MLVLFRHRLDLVLPIPASMVQPINAIMPGRLHPVSNMVPHVLERLAPLRIRTSVAVVSAHERALSLFLLKRGPLSDVHYGIEYGSVLVGVGVGGRHVLVAPGQVALGGAEQGVGALVAGVRSLALEEDLVLGVVVVFGGDEEVDQAARPSRRLRVKIARYNFNLNKTPFNVVRLRN